jgi:hypothetical protein
MLLLTVFLSLPLESSSCAGLSVAVCVKVLSFCISRCLGPSDVLVSSDVLVLLMSLFLLISFYLNHTFHP